MIGNKADAGPGVTGQPARRPPCVKMKTMMAGWQAGSLSLEELGISQSTP